MKWNKDKVFFALLVLIAAWFTVTSVKDASFLREQYCAVSIRLKEGGITERKLKAALEREEAQQSFSIPEVTAWMRIDSAEIKNKNLNRKQKVSAFVINGNMAMAVPMVLVNGNYVYEGDKKGCVIDTKAAYALFGTENAVSNVVTYEKKNYIIRGIVITDSPVFLIQGENDWKEYSNLELVYKEKERGETLAQEFLFQNGLTADYVMIDGYFYGHVNYSLITLPVWIFFFFAVYGTLKYFIRERGNYAGKSFILYVGILSFILISLGFLIHQFTGNPLCLPEKLVPAKWSDFGYWSKQFQSIKNQIGQLRYLNPNPKDILLADEISKLYLNISVLAVLYLVIFRIAGNFFKKAK